GGVGPVGRRSASFGWRTCVDIRGGSSELSVLTELRERFWSTLVLQLATQRMHPSHQLAALRWVGEVVSSPQRSQSRKEGVRALETGIVEALQAARQQKLPSDAERSFLIKLLVPLIDGPLLGDMDEVLRRCLGYYLEVENKGRGSTQFGG